MDMVEKIFQAIDDLKGRGPFDNEVLIYMPSRAHSFIQFELMKISTATPLTHLHKVEMLAGVKVLDGYDHTHIVVAVKNGDVYGIDPILINIETFVGVRVLKKM